MMDNLSFVFNEEERMFRNLKSAFMTIFVALVVVLVPAVIAAQPPEPPQQGDSTSGEIAFISNRDGNDYDIFIINSESGVLRQLTQNDTVEWYLSWAPYTLKGQGNVAVDEGGHLVFGANRAGDEDYELYAIPANCDSDPQGCEAAMMQITDNDADDLDPTWSPGYEPPQVAFVSNRDGDDEIYIQNVYDPSALTKVTDNGRSDKDPDWSPDGGAIAYAGEDSNGDYELFLFGLLGGGGSPRQLTDNDAQDEMPAFSPKGNLLAFASDRSGNYEIYVMNINTGEVEQITDNPGIDLLPDWSPDGERIVFASNRDGDYDLYVIDADRLNQRKLFNNNAGDLAPVWAPESIQQGQQVQVVTATPEGPCQIVNPDPGRVNVRTGPGTIYPVVGQINPGDQLPVTGVNGRWFVVNFSGQQGWIAGWVTQQRGDCAGLAQVPAPPTPVPPTPTDTPTPGPTLMPIPTSLPLLPTTIPLTPIPGVGTGSGSGSSGCSHPVGSVFQTTYNNNASLRSQLGCPQSDHPRVQPQAWTMDSAYQNYQSGLMIWLKNLGWNQQPTIFALADAGWYGGYSDPWDSSMPESLGLNPPQGLVEPIRGFGRVWQNNNLEPDLGWPTTQEQAGQATLQNFANGDLLHLSQTGAIYVLLDGGSWFVAP